MQWIVGLFSGKNNALQGIMIGLYALKYLLGGFQ